MDKRNNLNVARFTLGAGGYKFKVDGDTITVALDSDWVVDEGSTPTATPTTVPPTTGPPSHGAADDDSAGDPQGAGQGQGAGGQDAQGPRA